MTSTPSQTPTPVLPSLKRLSSLTEIMTNTLRRRKGGGKEEGGEEEREDGRRGGRRGGGGGVREDGEDRRLEESEEERKRVSRGVKRILRKNGGERSENELNFLQERLVETVQFFQTLGIGGEMGGKCGEYIYYKKKSECLF